jgi:hypothetical protein
MELSQPLHPKSRQSGLLIDHVSDETIVYDEDRQEAHSLNRAASIVWESSDGERTVPQLAALLAEKLGIDANDSIVEYALNELARVHLLESEPGGGQPLSRRDALRKMSFAGAAAIAIPVVLSLAAPTPAMAASGGSNQNGQGQNNNNQGQNQQ